MASFEQKLFSLSVDASPHELFIVYTKTSIADTSHSLNIIGACAAPNSIAPCGRRNSGPLPSIPNPTPHIPSELKAKQTCLSDWDVQKSAARLGAPM